MPLDLRRRNGDAGAGAADEDATLGVAGEHRLDDREREVGVVVAGIEHVGAEVDGTWPSVSSA